MKKLAIITISWGKNYGNKLQNYAMQEIYTSLGFSVETIKFLPEIKRNHQNKKKTITIYKIKDKIYRTIHKKKLDNINNERSNCFNDFNKNIKYTKEYTEKNYKEIPQVYDYYSVGSDQVWNAYFPDYSDYYLIDFINSKNKIAYSPSIGTTEIPDDKIETFRNALKKFSYISCREQAGAELLKKILKKDVKTLIDPTLLLDRTKWENVIKKPKNYNGKKYVLCYFLGMKNKENMRIIRKYAKERKLEIINLLDYKSRYYGTGPSEFLFLEKNAEIIFTDSFHSSVFALVFNKPFVIFKRNDEYKSMDSRLDTLISKFQLKNREYNGKNITINNEKPDYTSAYEILAEERKKSMEFLKKSLGIK